MSLSSNSVSELDEQANIVRVGEALAMLLGINSAKNGVIQRTGAKCPGIQVILGVK